MDSRNPGPIVVQKERLGTLKSGRGCHDRAYNILMRLMGPSWIGYHGSGYLTELESLIKALAFRSSYHLPQEPRLVHGLTSGAALCGADEFPK